MFGVRVFRSVIFENQPSHISGCSCWILDAVFPSDFCTPLFSLTVCVCACVCVWVIHLIVPPALCWVLGAGPPCWQPASSHHWITSLTASSVSVTVYCISSVLNIDCRSVLVLYFIPAVHSLWALLQWWWEWSAMRLSCLESFCQSLTMHLHSYGHLLIIFLTLTSARGMC